MTPDGKIKVGIVGAAGYTAGELLRILVNHPRAEVVFAQSGSHAGEPVWAAHADLLGETKLRFVAHVDLSGEGAFGGSTASLRSAPPLASQSEAPVPPLNVPRVAVVEPAGLATPTNGQVLVFGKVGHAEVLGLLGQVGGDAVVIENMDMLLTALKDGTIRTDVPLEIFSQTTKSPTEYSEICAVLSEKAQAGLTVHNTICSQVASRHEELSSFALSHDIIIFVSGASSSNGKVLCDLCRSRNPRTYHISSPEEINPSWFCPDDQVGICGATSTPRWLLESVAEAIRAIPLSF